MSYSFLLKDGDLSLTGSVVNVCSGKDKLAQDVDLWLREIYGADRFHSSFGSVIESYVGSVVGLRVSHDIVAEVHRVLTNLQNLQVRRLKLNPSKYTPDELLQSVIDVTATISFDTITVYVVYQSGANIVQTTQVNISV